ncbi:MULTISPECIES: BsuPI-related putative proteinase inhibitor [Pseudomonadati]|uniref:Intracellular proteinase inhibitor BsuPI domain-containing protein n=1 Tax=Shewanella aestuarii TaxID=1028752 RepID=A0ABT0KXT9_9GAMM|nr:BsuPI-related putative proteinase inhibitor [Shewanella aestuarii]MCL1116065.1 BsuPI-related putative proteinase inhibitor [Shewanella aestuarii]GGN70249.1 hypothetical protein GCM10009193_05020 [Shewanella aestuarii]
MRNIIAAMSLMTLIGCAGGMNSDVQANHVKPVTDTHKIMKLSAGEEMQTMNESVLHGHLDVEPFYQDAKSMAVSLTVTNQAAYGVDIQFFSGMSADLWLLDPKGGKVWAWSDTMMFTQALRQVRIGAGKSLNTSFNVPADVLTKIDTKGYRLQAKFVGKALESRLPTMNEISVELLIVD